MPESVEDAELLGKLCGFFDSIHSTAINTLFPSLTGEKIRAIRILPITIAQLSFDNLLGYPVHGDGYGLLALGVTDTDDVEVEVQVLVFQLENLPSTHSSEVCQLEHPCGC